MEYQSIPEPKKRRWGGIAAAIIAVFLVVIVALLVLPSMMSISGFLSSSDSTSTFAISPSSGTNSDSGSGSTIEITYPSDYNFLVNYTLAIINENRTSSGLSPVVLSPEPSGQQHADSMLSNNYFSHWDTQGYKPYMRYTTLNGTGFVEENVAYEYTSLPTFTSTAQIEKAIGLLEWQMMNNDSECCSNGHRDNILNSFHNRVSIGIAYDSTRAYFVEDFETFLTSLTTPISQGNIVTLIGNTSGTINPTSVLIYYDSSPTPLSSAELDSEYAGPYDQGSFVGGIVPPCNSIFGRCLEFAQGITEQATTWKISGTTIDIQFPISNFVQKDGDGVYTVYLVQGSDDNPEFLTSISVFVPS